MFGSKKSFASLPYYEGNTVDSWLLGLDAHYEWKGFWWLPDSTDKRISGVLKFNPRKSLTLSLSFSTETFSCPPSRWEVLFGKADGQRLSLFGCFPNSPSPKDLVGLRRENAPQLEVKVEKVPVNAHFENGVNFRFVEFFVAEFDEWVGMLSTGGASRPAGLAEVEIRERDEKDTEANNKRVVSSFSSGYAFSTCVQESV